jgi:cobalt-zinc-cadmium efflux system outer membrane protein
VFDATAGPRRRAALGALAAFVFAVTTARADDTLERARTRSPEVLSLAQAVTVVRTRAFDVLLAAAAARGAAADVRAAFAPPNPTLTLGPSRRVDCWSGPCSEWGAFGSLSDEGLIEGTITRKRALLGRVARDAFTSARFARADVERVVIAQAKAQYVRTVAARLRLEFAKEVAASLAQSVAVNRARYPRVIDEGQLARVEQEAMKADQEVDRARRDYREQEITLAQLLGYEAPLPTFTLDASALAFRVPDALASIDERALLRLALDSRPDRRRAEADIERSEQVLVLERRRRFPDIALLVQYQNLGTGRLAPQPPTVSVGLGFPLPVLYQRQGEIARAAADREAAVVTRRRVDTAIAADLSSALNGFAAARSIVARYEASLLERAKLARDITRVQFDAGSASLTDLLDAQRSWVQANSDYYVELANYWTAVFLVEQAVGRELLR